MRRQRALQSLAQPPRLASDVQGHPGVPAARMGPAPAVRRPLARPRPGPSPGAGASPALGRRPRVWSPVASRPRLAEPLPRLLRMTCPFGLPAHGAGLSQMIHALCVAASCGCDSGIILSKLLVAFRTRDRPRRPCLRSPGCPSRSPRGFTARPGLLCPDPLWLFPACHSWGRRGLGGQGRWRNWDQPSESGGGESRLQLKGQGAPVAGAGRGCADAAHARSA